VCVCYCYRGYIAVVNRSQKDIIEDLPIRQGLIKEQKFFQSHPKYRDTLSKCGTSNLARSLNQILMLHIRDSLPDIKIRIVALLNSVQVQIFTCPAFLIYISSFIILILIILLFSILLHLLFYFLSCLRSFNVCNYCINSNIVL
jgi:Dynamin central region